MLCLTQYGARISRPKGAIQYLGCAEWACVWNARIRRGLEGGIQVMGHVKSNFDAAKEQVFKCVLKMKDVSKV